MPKAEPGEVSLSEVGHVAKPMLCPEPPWVQKARGERHLVFLQPGTSGRELTCETLPDCQHHQPGKAPTPFWSVARGRKQDWLGFGKIQFWPGLFASTCCTAG